ncbi:MULTISPECIES: phosphatase PAP2 family protein [unclassified Variovorax]|jgi:membrane-associated phospholipid phosphatase|uniref:phosphatase PAP2 family protein n=1 Tax=unclassified Variovorax TaxID=663243 RepID=UPI000F7F3F1D|nr:MULTISPECIES: phosphatase PAP2 family protein [unclassified Variovorax]RSZ32733.1 phosphatase PAP2 family protein [Variovorax sp. 553]RSZ33030.1 phosphatase PAP2 family protein [Variovorax sp. 679]
MTPSASEDTSSPSVPPWLAALWRRCITLFPLKLVGNTVATLGFFPLYFWIMKSAGQAWVLPLTPIDRLIAFWPALLPVYLSLWGYIALPVLLARDRRELLGFSFGCAAMTAIALLVFWFMPTAIPNFVVDTTPGTSLQFLKMVDSAGNAFPSLHVSFSVFTCVALARQLRAVGAPAWLRVANVAWAAGIVYSTMAVRQHVLIDVLGGFALGVALGVVTRQRNAVA